MIAHDLAFFGSELRHLHDDGQCVVSSCAVAAMDGSLIDASSQIAVVEVGEDGLLRRVDDDDGIRSFGTTALCVFLALGDVSVAEAGEFLFVVDPDDSVVEPLATVCPIAVAGRRCAC